MRLLIYALLCCFHLVSAQEKFYILSFDGGGIRGVIPLTFLSEIKKATGIDIAKKADLIAGTSTGSIIATALCLPMDIDMLLQEYQKLANNAFTPTKSHFIDYLIQINSKYSQANLKNSIVEIFEKKLQNFNPILENLSKKIVIPTVRLSNPRTKRWNIEVHENFTKQGSQTFAVDAILQSTAAPTYFPSYQNCVDGGMGANNPALIALSQTLIHTPYKLQDVHLISFGTGYTTEEIEKGEDWGVYSWIYQIHPLEATQTPLLSMLFDLQDNLPTSTCQHLLNEQFFRVDIELKQAIDLDDVSKIPLLITLVKEYIETNPAAFQKMCDWAKENFQ